MINIKDLLDEVLEDEMSQNQDQFYSLLTIDKEDAESLVVSYMKENVSDFDIEKLRIEYVTATIGNSIFEEVLIDFENCMEIFYEDTRITSFFKDPAFDEWNPLDLDIVRLSSELDFINLDGIEDEEEIQEEVARFLEDFPEQLGDYGELVLWSSTTD